MLLYQRERWGSLVNPLLLVRQLWSHRRLIWKFTLRQVEMRHRGSWLGLIWAGLYPLFVLGVYTFVFLFVFDGRFGVRGEESRIDYSLGIFLGLSLLQLVSEPLVGAPAAVVTNPNFVKKVTFPLEILPLSLVGAALVNTCISVGLVVLGAAWLGAGLSPTVWWLPAIVLPVALAAAGIAWLVAAVGVFLRDLVPMAQFAAMLLMFFSAVFYPPSKIPEAFGWLRWNPLLIALDEARGVLLWHQAPDAARLVYLHVFGVAVFLLGYAVFARLKSYFADVL